MSPECICNVLADRRLMRPAPLHCAPAHWLPTPDIQNASKESITYLLLKHIKHSRTNAVPRAAAGAAPQKVSPSRYHQAACAPIRCPAPALLRTSGWFGDGAGTDEAPAYLVSAAVADRAAAAAADAVQASRHY